MPLKRYQRHRIVNINVNIIISSLLATALAAYPVYLTKMVSDSMIFIVLFSFFVDAIFDLIIFIGLHIMVHKHHVQRLRPSKIILKDLTRIQVQRVFLSVIYFAVAVGLHYALMLAGLGRVSSFIISYIFALIVTRSIHTIYGMRCGLFDPV